MDLRRAVVMFGTPLMLELFNSKFFHGWVKILQMINNMRVEVRNWDFKLQGTTEVASMD
jgi:hypothetical protein